MNESLKSAPRIMYDPRPYYDNENGLYYVFSKDISSFDSNLSADLYNYYQTVLDIELKRQYIADHAAKIYDGEKLTEVENVYVTMYSTTMMIEMIYSIEDAEKIKNELKEKFDLNLDLPVYYNQIFHIPRYTAIY